jgi:hypothetical protein
LQREEKMARRFCLHLIPGGVRRNSGTNMSSPIPRPRPSLVGRIRSAWRGEAPLSWAFWFFNFGGGLFLLAVGILDFLFLLPFAYSEESGVQGSPLFWSYVTVWLSVYLLYVVASIVVVYRCRFNVETKAWGYIASGLMMLWVLRLANAVWVLVFGGT